MHIEEVAKRNQTKRLAKQRATLEKRGKNELSSLVNDTTTNLYYENELAKNNKTNCKNKSIEKQPQPLFEPLKKYDHRFRDHRSRKHRKHKHRRKVLNQSSSINSENNSSRQSCTNLSQFRNNRQSFRQKLFRQHASGNVKDYDKSVHVISSFVVQKKKNLKRHNALMMPLLQRGRSAPN